MASFIADEIVLSFAKEPSDLFIALTILFIKINTKIEPTPNYPFLASNWKQIIF